MKILIFVACFIIAVSANCIPDNGNGRPSCNSVASLGTSHRNHWDPTAFWICEAINQAISVRCGVGLLYSAEAEKCIPAHEWTWTPSCVVYESSTEEAVTST